MTLDRNKLPAHAIRPATLTALPLVHDQKQLDERRRQSNEVLDISFTVPEAARYLRLSVSFLNKGRCYGTGPRFCKLGRRRVVYRKSDLDKWREENLHVSTSQY